MALAHDALSESSAGTSPSASVASFSWTHTPVGTPRSVILFVHQFEDADDTTSVTYGGTAMGAVSGGMATCTDGDEDCRTKAYHLGTGIPTGAQTVVVNRNNNANRMYATCLTATAGADTEVYTAGIVLLQTDGTLAEQSVTDGSPGTNSIRYGGLTSGLDAVPSNGANSSGPTGISIDVGAMTATSVYETTPGQGSRSVGHVAGTTNDRAGVYLAVREAAAGATVGGPLVGARHLSGGGVLTGRLAG